MARQKRTEGIDTSELPDLTPKQLAYVMARMEGKSQSDAYRQAYDAEKMAPNSIWTNASKLESSAKVALWLQVAREQGRLRAECTLEGHLAELDRLKRIAIETGNVGAAVQAEKIRGEVAGHKTERIQVQDDRTIADMLQQIEQALGPTVAASIGRQLGVELDTKH